MENGIFLDVSFTQNDDFPVHKASNYQRLSHFLDGEIPWKIIFKSTTVELSSIQLVWFCGWDPRLSAPCEVKHPSDLDKVRQRAKKLPGMPRMVCAGLDRHGFVGNQKGTGWKRMGRPISIRIYIYIIVYIYTHCILHICIVMYIYIYTHCILYIVMYIYT